MRGKITHNEQNKNWLNLPQFFTRMANKNRREHPKSINFDIFPIYFYFFAMGYFSVEQREEREKKTKTKKTHRNEIKLEHVPVE